MSYSLNHALSGLGVSLVSEQAAYTALPIARKSRGERFEQVLEPSHCPRIFKLQENLDFNFYFCSIIGTRPDISNVDQVAENNKIRNDFTKFSK